MSSPTKQQVIQLYRGLIRSSNSFKDMRLKQYAQQRIGAEFRQAMSLNTADAINRDYVAGLSQLDIITKYAVSFKEGQSASFANNYH